MPYLLITAAALVVINAAILAINLHQYRHNRDFYAELTTYGRMPPIATNGNVELRPVVYWNAYCAQCGTDLLADAEFSAWSDADSAYEMAASDDGRCPSCYVGLDHWTIEDDEREKEATE